MWRPKYPATAETLDRKTCARSPATLFLAFPSPLSAKVNRPAGGREQGNEEHVQQVAMGPDGLCPHPQAAAAQRGPQDPDQPAAPRVTCQASTCAALPAVAACRPRLASEMQGTVPAALLGAA